MLGKEGGGGARTAPQPFFVSFQQITFKLGNLTDFKAFLPAVLTGFANWSQSKVEKPSKGLLQWSCEEHDDEFRSDDDNDDNVVWFPVRLRANGRNNSQHCCANNVGGNCCVRVGSGVQTDETTPNNVGTCSAS